MRSNHFCRSFPVALARTLILLLLQFSWITDTGGCIRNRRRCKIFNKCCRPKMWEQIPIKIIQIPTISTTSTTAAVTTVANCSESNEEQTKTTPTSTATKTTQIQIIKKSTTPSGNKSVCDPVECEAKNYEHCYCRKKGCYKHEPVFYANCSEAHGFDTNLMCRVSFLHCKCGFYGCGCIIT